MIRIDVKSYYYLFYYKLTKRVKNNDNRNTFESLETHSYLISYTKQSVRRKVTYKLECFYIDILNYFTVHDAETIVKQSVCITYES